MVALRQEHSRQDNGREKEKNENFSPGPEQRARRNSGEELLEADRQKPPWAPGRFFLLIPKSITMLFAIDHLYCVALVCGYFPVSMTTSCCTALLLAASYDGYKVWTDTHPKKHPCVSGLFSDIQLHCGTCSKLLICSLLLSSLSLSKVHSTDF